MRPRTVLAIDPGSSKCGLAIARREESGKITLLWRRVAPVEELPASFEEALRQGPLDLIVVGSGTRSRAAVEQLRELAPGQAILLVDERDTSMQARERYWEHHPRRGWRKLLPATLQVPPEEIDDFAALVIAERVLLA
jgi:RNase H-fold protein (predicted Holliday junction resolvase)